MLFLVTGFYMLKDDKYLCFYIMKELFYFSFNDLLITLIGYKKNKKKQKKKTATIYLMKFCVSVCFI